MSVYTFDYDSENYYPAAPTVEISVSRVGYEEPTVRLTALVDSGADATLLPIDVLRTVGARHIETRQMRGIVSHPIAVETYLAMLSVGSFTLTGLEVIAANVGAEAIVGRDVLNQMIVTLNGLANVVELSQ